MNKRLKVCQAAGCTVNLHDLGKPYKQKKRLCPEHMAAESLRKAGSEGLWRFCQQCGKLEPLHRFEGMKKSCTLGLQRRRGINVTVTLGKHPSQIVPLNNLGTPTSCQVGCQLSGTGESGGPSISTPGSTSPDMWAPPATGSSCCTTDSNSSSVHMQMMPTAAISPVKLLAAVQNPPPAATDAAQPPSAVQQITSPMIGSYQSGAVMSSSGTPPPPAAAAAAALGGSPAHVSVAGCRVDLVHLCAGSTRSAAENRAYTAALNTIEEELVSAIKTTAQQQVTAAAITANPLAASGAQPGLIRSVGGGAYSTEQGARAAMLARLDELIQQFAALQQTLADDFAAEVLAVQQVGIVQTRPVLQQQQQQYSRMLHSASV